MSIEFEELHGKKKIFAQKEELTAKPFHQRAMLFYADNGEVKILIAGFIYMKCCTAA